jgi:hypothetical protein
MSSPQVNLTSHELRFIFSEDGWRVKSSQRGLLDRHSQEGDSFYDDVMQGVFSFFSSFLL